MAIPAWSVITWNPVLTTVDELLLAAQHMHPLGTSIHIDSELQNRRYGQVLWGTEIAGRPVGIAWDWAEVRNDLVAMADPMKVISNVVLIDNDGAVLDETGRIVYLNHAIHELHWQDELPASNQPWGERRVA